MNIIDNNATAILGMFFVTLLTRVGFLFWHKPLKLSVSWQYILKLAPTVALATTVMLDTFFYKQQFLGITNNIKILAVIIGIITFIKFPKIWISLSCSILSWCIFIYFGMI